MKKIILVLCFFQVCFCFDQVKMDSLMKIGVQYHDQGEYAKAIEVYTKALMLDIKSPLVNYELAMTYMSSGDYKNAIKHSDIVIEQNRKHALPAYIIKGSALSDLGLIKEAIKIFEEAIAKFGKHYLVYFNLGVSYIKIQDDRNGELAFINAINANPDHPSSHYLLAIIKNQQNERVQSLLGLYYFLLLEPSSPRSEAAYSLLRKQLGGNLQKDKNDSTKVTIIVDASKKDSEFSSVEFMIPMLEASNNLKENKGKSPEELFIENSKSLFSMLGQLKTKDGKKKTGIWWDFYIPFFYKLAESEYMDVFCYYISMSSNKKAEDWLKANNEKFENFKKWLESVHMI